MSGPDLIARYLDELTVRLPPAIVDELADGLRETYDAHRSRGVSDEDAARAAVAEFGDATVVAAAFQRVSPARRWARTTLGAGLVVGGTWAVALIGGSAWDWPVPLDVRVGFAAVVLAGVALLAASVLGTGYRRSVHTAIGAAVLVLVVDLTALGYVTFSGALTTWPTLLATAASSTRLGFTIHRSPRVLACL